MYYHQSEKSSNRFESLASCPLEGGVNLQISFTSEGLVAMAKNTRQLLEGKEKTMFLKGSLEFASGDIPSVIQALMRAQKKMEEMGYA